MMRSRAWRSSPPAAAAGEDAILLAEMHNFDGTMVDPDRGDMRHNLTPAAQVASRFWEYYRIHRRQGVSGQRRDTPS